MRATIETYTGKGNQPVYEDFILAEYLYDDSLLCIVADGMGELDYAADASRLVVEVIKDVITEELFNGEMAVEPILAKAIEAANERILQERQRLFCRMGVAVAILLCHKNRAYISWLGDVRVYLVRGSSPYQLTTDHTIYNLSSITVLDTTMYRHILTRCIKGSDLAKIPLIEKEILSGDRFILCSDGFYNNTDNRIISTSSIKDIVDGITDQDDDYSVIEVSF